MNRRRPGRVRPRRLHAAPGCAGAPGDDRLGVLSGFPQLLGIRFATDDAGHAAGLVLVEARVALAGKNVIAFMLLDGLVDDRFGFVTGRGHDRVVIVERQHRQDDVLDQRMRGSNKGLRAAGAFEAMQPEHWDAGLVLHGARDLWCERRPETHRGRGQAAVFQKAAARNALPAHHLIEGFNHCLTPPGSHRFTHGLHAGRTLQTACQLREGQQINTLATIRRVVD